MGTRNMKRRERGTRRRGDAGARGGGGLKKQNSYRVIMIGNVKAFSFVFIARIAERRDKIYHRETF
jgi:hypothetical protein